MTKKYFFPGNICKTYHAITHCL